MNARPNILLLVVDALRFDAVPSLSRWRRFTRVKGFRFFANHYATAHCSDPNFASLLTGCQPDEWRIFTQMGAEYTRVLPTLPVGLKQLGYHCWAQMPILCPAFYRYGYDEIVWAKTSDVTQIGFEGAKSACQRLGEPWFGFVRTMDCHYPYGAPDLPRMTTGDVDRETAKEGYWRAVRHTDNVLVALLGWVLENYHNTHVFVTADHGESLGEHGIWDHLYTLYEVLVHVPTWVRLTGSSRRLHKCRGLTQHTDVVATICDLLEIPVQGVGVSWLPWLRGAGKQPDRDHVFLVGWGAVERNMWRHRAVRGQRWKYIVSWHKSGQRKFELYDLESDQGETRNVLQSNPAVVREHADLLAEVAPGFPRPESPLAPAFTPEEALAVEQRLRALGYL